MCQSTNTRKHVRLVLLAALSACAIQLVIVLPAQAKTTPADCKKQQQWAQDKCVRDTCRGACTEGDWNACVRAGDKAGDICLHAINTGDAASYPPTPPRRNFRPKQANNPEATMPTGRGKGVPPANILETSPGFSSQGPSGMGTPGGAPAGPKGPVFQ